MRRPADVRSADGLIGEPEKVTVLRIRRAAPRRGIGAGRRLSNMAPEAVKDRGQACELSGISNALG